MIRTVVHFTDTTGFGGAEKMMLATLAGLDRSRWRPVLMHYPNQAAPELESAAREIGVTARVIPGATGARGIPDLPRFAAALREERTSILHAHLVGPLRCTKSFVAARLAGIPVVATQHLYGDLPHARDRARQRFAASLVDRYIAVSEGTARDLRRYLPDPGKVVVVWNAIDPARFREADGSEVRRELGGQTDRPVVLTLARLHERKGVAYLLSAITTLPDAILAIAGDGPEMDRLKEQARHECIADRVRFLGMRTDVPALFAACDLFVLPSLTEGLPVSVIEAMTAGKAVVATAIPGTDEIVVNEETGLLVPPGDAVALREAVGRLLGDPEARARMGAAGRRRVEEHFFLESMIGRIEALYESLLSEDAPRRPGAHDFSAMPGGRDGASHAGR